MKYLKYIGAFIIGYIIDLLLDKHNKKIEYNKGVGLNYISAILWPILLYFKGFSLNTFLFAITTSLMFSSSKIDIKYKEIPDLYNLSIFILGILYICNNKSNIAGLLPGGVYLFVFLSIVMILSGSLGAGDVKMSGIGFFIGKSLLLEFLSYAFLSAAIFGIFLLIFKKKSKNDTFAFGPFISLSAYIVYLLY
jgi:leader peptidase (prepilin peptidase)/N-methyltransferase